MASTDVAPNAESLAAADSPLAVSMEEVMEAKLSHRERDIAAGVFDEDRYAPQSATPCRNGNSGEYSCENVDLRGFLRHQDLGSETRTGNDVWGWTSLSGREFGIVGQTDGVGFVEVLKDGSLRAMGRLPTQTTDSVWRDIKVIGRHAYIGSEAPGHGLQVFDLTKLLTVDARSPPTFDIKSDLTAHFSGFGSSHNIVAHGATRTIFAVGTSRNGSCKGGLWMVDVSDPAEPRDAGCFAQDGYVHDAQCVIYKGPDRRYRGCEICFCYDESALTIVDVTRRRNAKRLSVTPYRGASYTHQGWLTGHDQRPVFTGYYKSPAKAIDHNLYVVDGLSYMSNYGSGLRIVNVTSVAENSSGSWFREVGFFDVYPEDDAVGGEVTFNGAWSVYPYFRSGNILVNSIERGIFSVKLVL
ncbi:uncharacterized protein UV8b_07114 [Ustilaginoidea virens]|uniref:Regulatory P domain-containing protein n=1 Tax=Ustilaginoidea virens TaxID=1159556 RepID=A0A8E5HWK4_USTVR|nr:uncharacterized protein UV8b_07114 [Ustilaginoidea virens]QUC22873.1 hypothetical protein UV8b_07114 [Ustilaginoidea virens]